MESNFTEVDKKIIYAWEQDSNPSIDHPVVVENDFGGDKIDISTDSQINNFKKQPKETDEEDKIEVTSNKSASMQPNENETNVESISSSVPWLTSRTEVSDPWIKLHNEIVEFYRLYGPNPKMNNLRRDLFLKVKNVIRKFFPGSVVKMFGSTAAMLYLPKSDIDIVVFLPKQSNNDHKSAKKLHKLISKISWVKS